MRYALIVLLLIAAAVRAQPAATDAAPAVSTDLPVAELKLLLLPLTLEETQQQADDWLGALRDASEELARAVISRNRAKADNDQTAAARWEADIAPLREIVAALRSRLDVVLASLETKGADAAQRRLYLASIQQLIADAAPTTPPGDPDDAPQAEPETPVDASLQARVDAEARRVQADPPVHERPEPWAVPLTEFENELQPLRAEQIDARVQIWLDLLQGEVRKRNRLNIASEQVADEELRQALLDRAEEQQARINLIAERVNVAISLLARRGGDTETYRRYVNAVTGVRFNLADPAVLSARAWAWLRSPDGGVGVGMRILTFVLIIAAAWLVARLVGSAVAAAVKRIPKASALLQDFLVGGTKRTILLIGLIIAVSRLGVDITPLIAAIGAAGLVIGLALQGTLGNFASGILILAYRPYDVGDVIDAGGVFGKVESMNLVSTKVATFDNQLIVVPNSQVWGGSITNVTARKTRRVDLVFGIGYADDIAKAQSILEKIVKEHPKTLDTPAPIIKVNTLNDSSVDFICRPWCKTADYWDVYWDLTRQVKEAFDAQGVGIPFPQRDLHLPEAIRVTLENRPAPAKRAAR